VCTFYILSTVLSPSEHYSYGSWLNLRQPISWTQIQHRGQTSLWMGAVECVKKGQKGKSIYNKLVVISQVMKQYGKAKLLKAAEWPSFVETVRPI
jgi:hypothetical protein